MKKFGKKLMALAMAGVMMCSPLMVSAAETSDKSVALAGGSSTGSGSLEGWVDSEVFIVDLPTEPVGGSPYNFKLDPQHLLNKTQGDTYTNADATVWFGTNPGTSEPLKAKSKSNIPVELSVTASVAGLKGTSAEIVMTDDDTFTDDTATSLYMGVNLDGATAAIAAGKTEAKASVTLEAVAEDKFEFKYDAGSDPKYTYEFVGDDADAKEADFALKAACNDAADWGSVAADEGITPSVTVAWSMKPSVPELTVYKKSTGTGAITVTTNDVVKSAKLVKYNGAANTNALKAGTNYSVSGKTFTLLATWASGIKNETVIELTLANGQTQTLTIIVQDTPPELTYTYTKSSNTAITVTTFDEVKSAKLVKFNGAANTNALAIGTNCSVSGNQFTLLASWTSKITAETVISLTLADGQTQTLTITVK